MYDHLMDANDHEFCIRTITEDGELVSEDRDFHVNARFDWFATVVDTSASGEVVQLIDEDSNIIVAEELIE